MKLSVIIPVLNEAGNIEILNQKIKSALSGKVEYEAIWIDDGSKDDTPNILASICKEDSHNIGITLMTRSGQSAALMAGIDTAKGEFIATIDGDNQNDPDEFLKMLEMIESDQYDVVVGWRKNRWKGNIIRRIPSLIANKLLKSSFKQVKIHDAGCSVKVMRADLMKHIRLYGELHRFLTYILGLSGARIGEIEIVHRDRSIGKSKYGLSRTFTVIFDILNLKFLFMRRRTPLQIMGPLAFMTYGVGAFSTLMFILEKIINKVDVTGNPFFTIAIMSFVMGTQFITLGLLGELIIRSYFESSNKKTYIVRKNY